MASTYPTTLDSFATTRANTDVTDTTHPGDHNNANDAINKIEAELGTNPSLAASNVATLNTAMMSRWTPLLDAYVVLTASSTSATPYASGYLVSVSPLATAASPAAMGFATQNLDPANYAITGFTMKMRLIAEFCQNGVANAGTSVMTAGLYPVSFTGTTTTLTATVGTVITGSTAAQTGGSINTENQVISSTFTAPAADTYMMGVVVATAATAGATKINLRLEYNYA